MMMSGYDFLKSQVLSCSQKVKSNCDVVIKDCNPGIPNPGIGDALIPGFWDYEKCPNLRYICPKNTFSPSFGGISRH